jgi:N-acetylneuraminate lyase
VNIRCDRLLVKVAEAQAAGRMRNVRGIKYSDADLHVLANCVDFNGGEYDILYGKDEQLLGAWAMGCRGAVGSTYNYHGRVYNKMLAAAEAGDMKKALEYQRVTQKGVDLLHRAADYGHPACLVGKAMMEARLGGKNCGPPRVPNVAMPPEGKAKLQKDLEAMGFFDC